MSLQAREPLLADEEVLFKICEVGATTRVRPAVVDVDRSYKLPSRLLDARSKPLHLCLRVCDHKMHDFSDQRDPVFIGLSVAVRRAEAELAESNQYALPNNATVQRFPIRSKNPI
jgi:hypothetical protein